MSSFHSLHIHFFDTGMAKKFGIREAIVIQHFQYWIGLNKKLNKNFREGRYWTYQSRKAIQAHLDYMSEKEIRCVCEELVLKGVLIVGNFNKKSIDKTLWYAFANEEEFIPSFKDSNNVYERPVGQMERPVGQMDCPPGQIESYRKTDTIEEDIEEVCEGKGSVRERGSASPPHTHTIPLFEFERVKMPQPDFDALVKLHGHEKVMEYVRKLDEFSHINPKRFRQYESHTKVIKSWMRTDQEKSVKSYTKPPSKYHDFEKTLTTEQRLAKGGVGITKVAYELLVSKGRDVRGFYVLT